MNNNDKRKNVVWLKGGAKICTDGKVCVNDDANMPWVSVSDVKKDIVIPIIYVRCVEENGEIIYGIPPKK